MKIIFENEYSVEGNWDTIADGICERHHPKKLGFLELQIMQHSFHFLSSTIPSDYTIQRDEIAYFEAWTIDEDEQIFLMNGYLDDTDRRTAAETLTKFAENPELFEKADYFGRTGIWHGGVFYALKP